MLIQLADDLATGLTDVDVEAIEVVLQARRRGYHLLLGSRQIFTDLLKLDLSTSALATLRRVRRRQIEKLELQNATTCRIRLSSTTEPSTASTKDGKIIEMGLQDVRDFSMVDQATILGEHTRDAELAAHMAQVYALREGMSGVRQRCRIAGGGGDTTAEVFRELRDEPRLCVCVVDSDREAPGDALGVTARKVKSELRREKPWCGVVVTRCREAENQLPCGVLEGAVRDDPIRLGMVADLERCDVMERLAGLRDYGDMKGGTSLEWVFGIGPNDPSREFWMGMVTAFESMPTVRGDCLRRRRCRMSGNCGCWLMPRLGDGILAQCLAEMKMMSSHKISESLSPNIRGHWMFIGSTVFSWTCGAPRSFV